MRRAPGMTTGFKLRGIASIGKGGRFPPYNHLYEDERALWESAGKHVEVLEAQIDELQKEVEVLREGSLREAVEVVSNSKWDDWEMSMDNDVRLILSGVAEKKKWRWSLMAVYDDDYQRVDLASGDCGKVKDLDGARAVAEHGARTYLETLLSILGGAGHQ